MRSILLVFAIGLSALGTPAASSTIGPAEAEALAEQAEAGSAEAIAALIRLVDDPNSKVRYHVSWGLTRSGRFAVAPLLHELENAETDRDRASAARLLGRIGFVAMPAFPALRSALSVPDSSTAAAASYALGRLRAREAIPDLVAVYAACRRIPSQREMARALRDMGADQGARAARAGLAESVSRDLASDDPAIRDSAVTYTWELYRAVLRDNVDDFPMKAELRVLVPGLTTALTRYIELKDERAAERAMKALTLAGRDSAEAAPVLEQLIGHPQLHSVAMKALIALGSREAERIVAEQRAREELDKRIRSGFSLRDHQGHSELLLFRVAGSAADGLRMSVRLLFEGREPRTPVRVVVYLESTSMQARFADVREITWVADGTRVRLSGLERTLSQSQIGGVIETVSGTLPVPSFLALANARTLGANAAGVEFELGSQDLAALRHLAGKLPALANPR